MIRKESLGVLAWIILLVLLITGLFVYPMAYLANSKNTRLLAALNGLLLIRYVE